MAYKEMSLCDLDVNFFERIGTDWMLITAGDAEACNTMTASWGQVGVLWNRPVATVYIRPQRYTRQFVEQQPRFSLSFFAPGSHRAQLNLLGTKSGRDGDKIAEAGMAVELVDGVPALAGADLVLLCKKLYQQDLSADGFLNTAVDEANYPAKDYHRMYVAEIERVLRGEG